MNLNVPENELQQYSRHLLIREFDGAEGYARLKGAKVAVFGAGGLGCPAAIYLASAGVGTLLIVDDDVVSACNLTRQIAYSDVNVGHSKSETLANHIRILNKFITVEHLNIKLDENNFEKMINYTKDFTVFLDCTDNPHARYCINVLSVFLNIPFVSGSCLKWEGQVSVFNYKNGPCYKCMFSECPNKDFIGDCNSSGIVSTVTGVIGTVQAQECIKIILNVGEEKILSGRLFFYDGLNFVARTIKIRGKLASCVCSFLKNNKILIEKEKSFLSQVKSSLCKRKVFEEGDMCVNEFDKLIHNNTNGTVVFDVREAFEFSLANLRCSVNLPFSELSNNLFENFQKNIQKDTKLVILICQKGNLSKKAQNILIKKFPSIPIRNLFGGLDKYSELAPFPRY